MCIRDRLEVLAKTPYADLIRPFSVTNMEDFDYTACESVLRKYFYDQVMKIVDQEFSCLLYTSRCV